MRLIQLDSLTPTQVGAWSDLAARAAEPNPFYEPPFVLASARAEGDAIELLYEEEDGAWVGCLPVTRRGPLRRGWRSSYSFLGTPLVEPEAVDRFAAALLGEIAAGRRTRFLLLHRISRGPVLAGIERAAPGRGVGPVFERLESRAALRRREDGDYLSGLKSKRRSELKRQRRKLEEQLGGELEVVEPTDIAAGVDSFLALEAAGWKGRQGTAMASDPATAGFFREICAGFAAVDRLRLRSLVAAGEVTAMTCDLRAGDSTFGFKTSYAEDLHRFSPGIQLQVENFAAFHAEDKAGLYDSCSEPGGEAMPDLWPDQRLLATVAFGPAGAIGRLAGAAIDRYLKLKARRRGSRTRD